VQQGLRIVDTSCHCKKSPSSCSRSVIENRLAGGSQGSFTVQKISVRMDQPETWDLSILGRPQHPMFKDSSKVECLTCKFLNLDFSSVPDREKFNRDLGVALKLRDKDDNQYQKVSSNAEFLSHKPNHFTPTERTASFALSRPSSVVSDNNLKPNARRTSSTAPSIARFSQSPTFVASPILASSTEKMATKSSSRKSSATSSDVRTPTTLKASTIVPSIGRLSMSPVLSDSFPWQSGLENANSPISSLSPATQQPPRPDVEIHSDPFAWPVHSGDPWYPGKT